MTQPSHAERGSHAYQPATGLSRAVLSIWNDIDPEIEGEYEAWYQRDHLRDRVGTPGFKSCRRYRRVSGEGREYFTFSDLESAQVASSPAYRERLAHATAWTRRIMPHFRRLIRVAADVSVDLGDGISGAVATALYENAGDARRASVRAAVAAAAGRIMQEDACVTRVRVFEANAETNGIPNPEAALRPDAPRSTEIAIVVEGSSEMAVAKHLASLQALPELAGLSQTMPASVYRLLFCSRG